MFAVVVVPAQTEVLKQSGVPPIAPPLTPAGVIRVVEAVEEVEVAVV